MKKRILGLAGCFALLLAAAAGLEAAEPATVVVDTPNGPLRGLATEGGIRVFRGVPYAEPPVGELRFAPPRAVKPWREPRDATRYGPSAMQPSRVLNPTLPPTGDDCLNLNVWTPADKPDAKLPVYVYIHGGGYAIGGGGQGNFDGTNFARNGVVCVTINYRLNIHGFLATRETLSRYGTTGNWGTLDQILALEWVRDHIAAFGGDPARVTIGGESAGSYSVSALLLSPRAKGLFHGAIMESGSILGAVVSSHTRSRLDRAIAQGAVLADLVEAGDSPEGLARLRAVDAHVLAELSPMPLNMLPTPLFFLMPAFDGATLPADPCQALNEGAIHPVPLLIGGNTDEGSMFIPADTLPREYEMLAQRMFGPEKGKKVLARFPVSADADAGKQARHVFGLGMFHAANKPFADVMARLFQPVYVYHFAYASETLIQKGLGAMHGTELGYVFNNLTNPTENEKRLADAMHRRWVNFIKSGDPNTGLSAADGPAWPRYRPETARVLRFDTTLAVEEIPYRDDTDFVAGLLREITRPDSAPVRAP